MVSWYIIGLSEQDEAKLRWILDEPFASHGLSAESFLKTPPGGSGWLIEIGPR